MQHTQFRLKHAYFFSGKISWISLSLRGQSIHPPVGTHYVVIYLTPNTSKLLPATLTGSNQSAALKIGFLVRNEGSCLTLWLTIVTAISKFVVAGGREEVVMDRPNHPHQTEKDV